METTVVNAIRKAVDLEILNNNLYQLVDENEKNLKKLEKSPARLPILSLEDLNLIPTPQKLKIKEYFNLNPDLQLSNRYYFITKRIGLKIIKLLISFLVMSVIFVLFNYASAGPMAVVVFSLGYLYLFIELLMIINQPLKDGLFRSKKRIYKDYLVSYDQNRVDYEVKKKAIETNNQILSSKYQKESEIYDTTKSEMLKLENGLRESNRTFMSNIDLIKKDLKETYDSIGLHEKYRQLIYIYKINEFIETRRVNELFGINGAINLLEIEGRQDKIIDLLSSQNDHFYEIRGQFKEMNQNVLNMRRVISEVSSFTQMTNIIDGQKMDRLIEINQKNVLATEASRSYQEYVLKRNGLYY